MYLNKQSSKQQPQLDSELSDNASTTALVPPSNAGTPVATPTPAPNAPTPPPSTNHVVLNGQAGNQNATPATLNSTTNMATASTSKRRSKRIQQLIEEKVQFHMDREDRRVKQITEGILYEFLPSALSSLVPHKFSPNEELTEYNCRMVACAALCCACLLNTPSGFIEFLMCIPWMRLPMLYPKPSALEDLLPNLSSSVSNKDKKAILNTGLEGPLLHVLLDFVLKKTFQESIPPMFVEEKQGLREGLSALLEGCTPLHCAALRGNPAQIDHLLCCGADPLLKTRAGDLALELVPGCGERSQTTGKRVCRCQHTSDQEAWECRTRMSRNIIMQRCICNFGRGLLVGLQITLLCFLCWLGLWGYCTDLMRPRVVSRLTAIKQSVKRQAFSRMHQQHSALHQTSQQGMNLLNRCRKYMGLETIQWDSSWQRKYCEEQESKQSVIYESHAEDDLDESSLLDTLQTASSLLNGSVGIIRDMQMTGKGVPFSVQMYEQDENIDQFVVPLDFQAQVYLCWAESCYMKVKIFGCPGTNSWTEHVLCVAHLELNRLLKRAKASDPERQNYVGRCLTQVLWSLLKLILQIYGELSPVPEIVRLSQKALQSWDNISKYADPMLDMQPVERMREWVSRSFADILLAEALAGCKLNMGNTVDYLIDCSVIREGDNPLLIRQVTVDVSIKLAEALGKSQKASKRIFDLAQLVYSNVKLQLEAAEQLSNLMSPQAIKDGSEGVQNLSEAINAAEKFPQLSLEVERAKQVHEQCFKRKQANERLQTSMKQVCEGVQGGNNNPLQLDSHIKTMEAALQDGVDSQIKVGKAKKLLRTLQAEKVAAESLWALEEVLQKRPCGCQVLRYALNRAEDAMRTLQNSSQGFDLKGCGARLSKLISESRSRLDVERAHEELVKALSASQGLAGLGRLEAAILGAKKAGALHYEHGEVYKQASELRERLCAANRMKQKLESTVRQLERNGKQEEATEVEKELQKAEPWGDLLHSEIGKAKLSLNRFLQVASIQTKLDRALKEGIPVPALARILQEAEGAGMDVKKGKKILKMLQGLEGVLSSSKSALDVPQLLSKVQSIEASGVVSPLLDDAKNKIKTLQHQEAVTALEAALKPHADWSISQRVHMLKAGLQKTRDALGLKSEKDVPQRKKLGSEYAQLIELYERAQVQFKQHAHSLEIQEREREKVRDKNKSSKSKSGEERKSKHRNSKDEKKQKDIEKRKQLAHLFSIQESEDEVIVSSQQPVQSMTEPQQQHSDSPQESVSKSLPQPPVQPQPQPHPSPVLSSPQSPFLPQQVVLPPPPPQPAPFVNQTYNPAPLSCAQLVDAMTAPQELPQSQNNININAFLQQLALISQRQQEQELARQQLQQHQQQQQSQFQQQLQLQMSISSPSSLQIKQSLSTNSAHVSNMSLPLSFSSDAWSPSYIPTPAAIPIEHQLADPSTDHSLAALGIISDDAEVQNTVEMEMDPILSQLPPSSQLPGAVIEHEENCNVRYSSNINQNQFGQSSNEQFRIQNMQSPNRRKGPRRVSPFPGMNTEFLVEGGMLDMYGDHQRE